jgi:hypothetical protein
MSTNIVDPARSSLFNVARGKIPVDDTTKKELMTIEPPTSVTAADIIGGISCINAKDNANVNFNISINNHARLDRSYLEVTMKAWRTAEGAPNNPLSVLKIVGDADEAEGSLPWCVPAVIFNTSKISFNQMGNSVEEYTSNNAHSIMMSHLLKYSHDALNSMNDRFFTPCIEARRDTSSLLSDESFQRVKNNFTKIETAAIEPGFSYRIATMKKNIYLSQLFDCCNIPASLPLAKILIELTINRATSDLMFFKLAESTDTFYLGITDIKLHLCNVTPTVNELDRITAMKAQETIKGEPIPPIRYSFSTYDVTSPSYSAGGDIYDPTVKNMQALIAAIPSKSNGDGKGINYLQYSHMAGEDLATPITSFQARYNDINSPDHPVTIDVSNPRSQSQLYALYRNIINRNIDYEIMPAIRADDMMTNNIVIGLLPANKLFTGSGYVLYCAGFYPTDGYAHYDPAGSSMYVYLKGGVNTSPIVCRVRTKFLQINSDYSVSVY